MRSGRTLPSTNSSCSLSSCQHPTDRLGRLLELTDNADTRWHEKHHALSPDISCHRGRSRPVTDRQGRVAVRGGGGRPRTFRYLGRGYASQTAAARRLTTAGQLCAFRVRSCGRLGRVTGRMVTSGVVLGGGAWSIALDRSNTILCSRL